MPDANQIENMQEALDNREMPTITVWNRLEGRPRRKDFDRSLKAEVRDALWMLTRQWQLGEFLGDDAGSPAFAKILTQSDELNKYQAGQHPPQSFNQEIPLEAKVEQRLIPFSIGAQNIALDLRLQMGRKWLKMIASEGDFAGEYIEEYKIEIPNPDNDTDNQICAHPEVWAQYATVAERCMDGWKLYHYLTTGSDHHAYDRIIVPEGKKDKFDILGDKFIEWFQQLYSQPITPEDNAWQPANLEYQFYCSATDRNTEPVFKADEYYHGHLDWYNLDVDVSIPRLDVENETQGSDRPDPSPISFIPAPIVFDGMPNTRWWTFEDSRTNFGDIRADTTDLAKLMLIEFGLVYANDWFLLPLTLPAGTVNQIKGLAVTNVFGERFWIEHTSATGEDWRHWQMFQLGTIGSDQSSELGVLLPTVSKIQEGPAMECVNLIRDEIANMVWGIETTIPLADGSSKPGGEAAVEFHNYLQKRFDNNSDSAINPPEYNANIRYQLMNTVPENWIPFIPVHLDNGNRQTQLQRAAMPRILEGSSASQIDKVRPRTPLLSEGRDKIPLEPYFIHEEEVPRAGVIVSQSFQRTRWYEGRVVVWLGARKKTGRGEGASGLAYDQLVPVNK